MMSESRGSASPRSVLARIRELRGLARDGERADLDLTPPSLEELLRHTRRQLIECARCVGLTGAQRLTKAALATRFQQELERIAILAGAQEPADASRKFDLGFTFAGADRPEHIPWGYGQDRVTAMVVDPERLYVYWEVTDEAIERARAALGPGGPDAWLNLRVYDVTDRIFDGTNAHHYFDHASRGPTGSGSSSSASRRPRPSSSSGSSRPRATSSASRAPGRADFPRREPVSPGRVEWLTVLAATGEVGDAGRRHRRRPPAVVSGCAEPSRPAPRLGECGTSVGPTVAWDGEWIIRDESFGAEWQAWDEWVRGRAIEWEGPIIRTSWEAGPFSYPVALAALRRGAATRGR